MMASPLMVAMLQSTTVHQVSMFAACFLAATPLRVKVEIREALVFGS
jgi:hypothetical protein